MEKVQMQLFGGYRKYIPSGRLEIDLPLPIQINELKIQFAAAIKRQCPDFSDHQLIANSRFATEAGLLEEAQPINEKKLAVLPPVCGG